MRIVICVWMTVWLFGCARTAAPAVTPAAMRTVAAQATERPISASATQTVRATERPILATPTQTVRVIPSETAIPTETAVEVTTAPTVQPTETAVEVTTAPTVQPTETAVEVTATPTGLPTEAPTVLPTPQDADPVLVGTGDIAVCEATGDEATATLLDNIPGTVFTLGDNVYPTGALENFLNCYEPSWGRHKARTRPVPGNHDYAAGNGRGYYEYFGTSAGEPGRGYYAYDLGAWHVIVLNSEIATDANSEQVAWLRDDLAHHPTRCTVAMFHRPLFSSGPHGKDGSGDKTRPLWDVLYENDVDVVLNGHDHDYERFAPQTPNGERDDARGIREFVVGTGGASPYVFGAPKANSEKRITGPFGVLKLTLHATGYSWEFVNIVPLLFKDSGEGECH